MRKTVTLLGACLLTIAAVHSKTASASGYLTVLNQGVTISGYMMNNDTDGGAFGHSGMTLFISGISNPDGCSGTDKVFIPSSVSNYNSLVAAVISAYASGQHVGFYSSGCGTMPFWYGSTTYPFVVTLWVIP